MRSNLMQDEAGQILEAESISAGLDYPGIGPEHAHLAAIGRATYTTANDTEVLDAFQLLARSEGIIPALESAHALAWVCRSVGSAIPRGSTVLITLSGRGDKDVAQVREILEAVESRGARVESTHRPGRLETTLRDRRGAGHKLLIPYVTGGMDDRWLLAIEALAGAGADAIEVGIPFSDPMIDGPTIQESSLRALARGTTPNGILADLSHVEVGIPLVVMTYYNLVYRAGHRRLASSLITSGVCGAIVPDLPLEELGPWAAAADDAGVETVLLVAPSTPAGTDRRHCPAVPRIRLRGGANGCHRRTGGAGCSAREVATRVGRATDMPVCIGIGVSTPDQAKTVCEVADGVVVGSALVRRLLEGAGPEGAADFVGSLRQALDAG